MNLLKGLEKLLLTIKPLASSKSLSSQENKLLKQLTITSKTTIGSLKSSCHASFNQIKNCIKQLEVQRDASQSMIQFLRSSPIKTTRNYQSNSNILLIGLLLCSCLILLLHITKSKKQYKNGLVKQNKQKSQTTNYKESINNLKPIANHLKEQHKLLNEKNSFLEINKNLNNSLHCCETQQENIMNMQSHNENCYQTIHTLAEDFKSLDNNKDKVISFFKKQKPQSKKHNTINQRNF